MTPIFPYANILAGLSILLVGFLFHWIGQLISVLNWELAVRLGLQEKNMPPAYKVYEHGIAIADVAIGWIYGITGAGLLLQKSWAFKLAWFPGVILIYHSISYWFWTANQKRAGHCMSSYRTGWFLSNFITGGLCVMIAWNRS